MAVRLARPPGEGAPLIAAVILLLLGSASTAGATRLGLDLLQPGPAPEPAPPLPAPPAPAAPEAPGAAAPTSPPPPAVPAPPPSCPPVVLGFARASSEAAPPVVEETRALAAWLREHPGVSAVLDGHADAVGAADQNLALSHERASRIAVLLRRAGVPAERLTTRGFGAYQPLEGAAGEGPAQRRVEVHLRGATSCFAEERRVVIP